MIAPFLWVGLSELTVMLGSRLDATPAYLAGEEAVSQWKQTEECK